MKHELKIRQEYFDAVVNGVKTLEARNNADRTLQCENFCAKRKG